MNKIFLKYLLYFIIACVITYAIQIWIIDLSSESLRYNVLDVDLFFGIASYIICVHFLFLETIEKLRPQLGFLYLPTLFIKGILFYFYFKNSIFSLETLTTLERVHLIIPLVVFLVLEVYLISRILTKKEA